MSKKVLTIIISFALMISFMMGIVKFEVVKANPFAEGSWIQIFSPSSGICQHTSVKLFVWVSVLNDYSQRIVSFQCSLDSEPNTTVAKLDVDEATKFYPEFYGVQKYSVFSPYSTLDNLSEGKHTLKVYSHDASGKVTSKAVEFRVDTRYVYPQVMVFSPQNMTYTSNEVGLTWTCNKQIVSGFYSVDYREEVEIPFFGKYNNY